VLHHIGVIGLGPDWESRHRPALHSLQDRFKVSFIYDEVALRARSAASQFNAVATLGFQKAIQSPQIEAILILDRQWTGLLPLRSACAAGKSIYWNAALDLQTDQQESILQMLESTHVPLMIEFPRRFAPATIRLKELVATHLGAPKFIFCHQRLTNGTKMPTHAKIQRSLGEVYDWCRYIVDGRPLAITSLGQPGLQQPHDSEYQMISVEFESKDSDRRVLAQISCGTYLQPQWPEAISFRPPAAMQICCENGIAFVDLPNTLTWFSDSGRHMESLEGERPVGERLLAAFSRMMENGNHHFDCVAEYRESTQVIQAAQRSMQEQRRIPLV